MTCATLLSCPLFPPSIYSSVCQWPSNEVIQRLLCIRSRRAQRMPCTQSFWASSVPLPMWIMRCANHALIYKCPLMDRWAKDMLFIPYIIISMNLHSLFYPRKSHSLTRAGWRQAYKCFLNWKCRSEQVFFLNSRILRHAWETGVQSMPGGQLPTMESLLVSV